MRPEVLNSGYSPATRLLFAVIGLASRQPLPDAAKLVFYRPGFYEGGAKRFTHEAMRGASDRSVADRELMAAYVGQANQSAFCVGAHTATAGLAYQDQAKVAAVLANVDTAQIEDGLRATLRMLGRLAREGVVSTEDMRAVLSAGVSRQQIKDALAVFAAFNTVSRLANAFDFMLLSPEGFQSGARYLLRRGYR